jgi:hypothetical protein
VIFTALPLTVTDAKGEKSEPVSVRVIAPDPARTLLGEREVSTGTNWVTGTFKAALVPPAGGGLTTARRTVVAWVSCVAVRLTVREVVFTNVEVTVAPLSCTVELGSKPEPVRVNVPELPAAMLLGETDVSTGVGLSTRKGRLVEGAVPGLTAAISAVSPEVRLEAGITAEREVELV